MLITKRINGKTRENIYYWKNYYKNYYKISRRTIRILEYIRIIGLKSVQSDLKGTSSSIWVSNLGIEISKIATLIELQLEITKPYSTRTEYFVYLALIRDWCHWDYHWAPLTVLYEHFTPQPSTNSQKRIVLYYTSYITESSYISPGCV